MRAVHLRRQKDAGERRLLPGVGQGGGGSKPEGGCWM